MRVKTKRHLMSLMLILLIVGISRQTFGQTLDVKGTVTSKSTGETLPGVTVLVKGQSGGTITDLHGNYSIVANPGSTLVFQFLGFRSQEIKAAQVVHDIVLEEDLIGLDEVVVVGYGSQLKKDITGSIGSIGSEDFAKQNITDVDQVLQGRSAGVTVTKASGAPGSAARIRIRGANSIIGSNEPLYVIDGFVGGDYEALNPNDIEAIQILKDASATAIYGSRGANGVVLITTKSGVKGAGKFSFKADYSLSENIKYWDMLSASEYVSIANANNVARGANPAFTDEEVNYFNTHEGTDWQKEMFRLAKGQSYQLNYSGGTDKTSYFVSGNFLDQEGIVINSDYSRFGIRTNVTSTINAKLKATVRTNFTRRESNNTGGNGGQRSALNQMIAWAPTTPVRNDDGEYTVRDPHGSYFENPVELANNDVIVISNSYSVMSGLTYKLLPGLTNEISLGADVRDRHLKNYTRGSLTNAPTASRQTQETVFWQLTNILSYKRIFNEIHKIDVAAIFEQQKNSFNSYGVRADNLLVPSLRYNYLPLADDNSAMTPFTDSPGIRSYLGRMNYDLLDRYLLSVSFRADGSSKFQGDNKYSTFPSLALGWNIHEEAFLKDGFFDLMKLRTSWGKTGNQGITSYGTLTAFDLSLRGAATSFENGTSTAGAIVSNPGNPNLEWETTDQLNIGFDLAFLDSRLSFSADAYKKNTHNLLVSVPLPQYVGGGSQLQNVGEVLNEGIELNFGANIIKTSDLNWYTSINASFMRNEVLDIGDNEQIFIDADAGEGTTSYPEGIIKVGHSLSSFYGLTYLGTWKEGEEELAALYGAVPGDARYKDLQAPGEEGYGIIDTDDAGIIGSGMPKGVYGWNNTIDFKNFSLNLFFQAVSGIERLNLTYGGMVSPGIGSNQVTHADVLDRWHPTNNPDSDIPHFSGTTMETIQSSRFVERADYIRLKNISLSYRHALKSGRDITLMLAAANLFTLTNYRGLDPEAYSNAATGPQNPDPRASNINADTRGTDIGAYPNSKIYSFSLNFNF